MQDQGLVERAFELAQDGTCVRVGEVKRQLKADGFLVGDIEGHLAIARLRAQLAHLCRQSQKQDPSPVQVVTEMERFG